ncbi:MAG: tetratricopeptide repeat protein [Candidatus Aminicenantales bacterium]
MRKAVLILAGIIIIGGCLAAQDWKGKGRLGGVVLDQDGKPIQGVTVKLTWSTSETGFETMTDQDGKWTGAWLHGGAWNLNFEKIGFSTVMKTVTVTEWTRTPELKLTMQKAQGAALTGDLIAFLEKANELFDQKNYPGAIDAYTAILAKFPDAYVIWKNIGNCYFNQELYDKAEEAYQKILAKNPIDSDVMLLIGNCYFNRNQTDKALEWYGKIQFEKITDATVLYNIGLNFFKSSKYEEALKYFLKSFEVQKDFEDGLYQAGVTYISLQKNAEAVAAFEKFMKTFPNSEKAPQVQGFLDYLKKK